MSTRGFAGVWALVAAAMAMVVPVASAVDLTSRTVSRMAAKPQRVEMVAFGGVSSQGDPVVLTLLRSLRIGRALAALDMKCTSGTSFVAVREFRNLPIRFDGSFSGTRSIAPQTGSSPSLTGGTDSLTGQLNFRRNTLTITGTWQLHLGFQMANGQTDQCDSGNVTFTAQL